MAKRKGFTGKKYDGGETYTFKNGIATVPGMWYKNRKGFWAEGDERTWTGMLSPLVPVTVSITEFNQLKGEQDG